jgi:hypothetical protein
MPRVLEDKEIIENVVKKTIQEMEQRAPIQMHRLKQDDEKYQKILSAARKSATEQVTMSKEFADQPSDILVRLKKHLPEERIKMIQAGLSLPTYRLDITKSPEGHHTVSLKREDEMFLASRNLMTMVDIDWTKIMQYASIVVEAVMLVLSAVGISPSPSSKAVEEATEDVAQALKNSSKFEKAMESFVEAWDSAGGSAYQKAKAIFYLIKDTNAAGLLWTVIKALCSNMAWYEWLETAAKVTAMVIAALATDGAALIAEIALVVMSAVDFARKLANLSQLETIKSSVS